MTASEIWGVVRILFNYLGPTLKLFGFTLLYSIPLGMIVALLKMCRFKPVAWLTSFYILVMRGTPLMLQIIVTYFAIPMLRRAEWLPSFLSRFFHSIDIQGDHFLFNAVLFAFVFNYAAYFAEIFRGGIESIPQGQYEAAAALSMTKTQTFFRIILPQVVKRVVPASANEVITLVKDTSLANVVDYGEITLKAKEQMQNYSSLVPLFIAGVFYFVLATILTILSSFIEKKLNYYK